MSSEQTGHNVTERLLNKKDKLIEYVRNPDDHPEMEEVWEMYMWIESKLRSMSQKNVRMVIKQKYNISYSWANRIIREVMSFSGMIHRPDREYLRMVQIEACQRDIEMAVAKGDFKAAAALRKEYRLWLFPPGESHIDPNKLKLQQFNIQINVSGKEVDLPLDEFYKIKASAKKELHQTESYTQIPLWDEIKDQVTGTHSDDEE